MASIPSIGQPSSNVPAPRPIPKVVGSKMLQGRAVTTSTYAVPVSSKMAKLIGDRLSSESKGRFAVQAVSGALAVPLEGIYRTVQGARWAANCKFLVSAANTTAYYTNEIIHRVIGRQQQNEQRVRQAVTTATGIIPYGTEITDAVGSAGVVLSLAGQTSLGETTGVIKDAIHDATQYVAGEDATNALETGAKLVTISATQPLLHVAGETQKKASSIFFDVLRGIIPAAASLAPLAEYFRNRNLARVVDPGQFGDALLQYADKTDSTAWRISHPHEKTRPGILMCQDKEFEQFKRLPEEGKRLILKELFQNHDWPLTADEYTEFSSLLEHYIATEKASTTLESAKFSPEDTHAMKTMYSIFLYIERLHKVSEKDYQDFCSQSKDVLDLQLSILASCCLDSQKIKTYRTAISHLHTQKPHLEDKEIISEMILALRNIPNETMEALVTIDDFDDLSDILKYRLLKTIAQQTVSLSDEKSRALSSLTKRTWSELKGEQKRALGETFLPYFNKLSCNQKEHIFDISKKEVESLSESERLTFFAEIQGRCDSIEEIAEEFSNKFPEEKLKSYARGVNTPEVRKGIRELVKFINENLSTDHKRAIRCALERPLEVMNLEEEEISQLLEKIAEDLKKTNLSEEARTSLQETFEALNRAKAYGKSSDDLDAALEELEEKMSNLSLNETKISKKISALDKEDPEIEELTKQLSQLSLSKKVTGLSIKACREEQILKEQQLRYRGLEELAQAASLLPSKNAGELNAPLQRIDEQIGKWIATEGYLFTPCAVSGQVAGTILDKAFFWGPSKAALYSGLAMKNQKVAFATSSALRTMAFGTRIAYMLGYGPAIDSFVLERLTHLGSFGQLWIDYVEKRVANLPMIPLQATVKTQQMATSAVEAVKSRANSWASQLMALKQENDLLKKGSAASIAGKATEATKLKETTVKEFVDTVKQDIGAKQKEIDRLKTQEKAEEENYKKELKKLQESSDFPEKKKQIDELSKKHAETLKRMEEEKVAIPTLEQDITNLQKIAAMPSHAIEEQLLKKASDPFFGLSFEANKPIERQTPKTIQENVAKTKTELERIRNSNASEIEFFKKERAKITTDEKLTEEERKTRLNRLEQDHEKRMETIGQEEQWIPLLDQELQELTQLASLPPEELERTLEESPYVSPTAQCKIYQEIFQKKAEEVKNRLEELKKWEKEDKDFFAYYKGGRSLLLPGEVEKKVEAAYQNYYRKGNTPEQKAQYLEEYNKLVLPYLERSKEKIALEKESEKLKKLQSLKPTELSRNLEVGTAADSFIAAVTDAIHPSEEQSYWQKYVTGPEKADRIVSPEMQRVSTAYKQRLQQEAAYATALIKARTAEERMENSSWFTKTLATSLGGGSLAGYYKEKIQPSLDSVSTSLSGARELTEGALNILSDTRQFENELAFKAMDASFSVAGKIHEAGESVTHAIDTAVGRRTKEAEEELKRENEQAWQDAMNAKNQASQKYFFGPLATIANTAVSLCTIGGATAAIAAGSTVAPVILLPFIVERMLPDAMDRLSTAIQSGDAGNALIKASESLQSAGAFTNKITSQGFASLGKALQGIINKRYKIIDKQRVQGFLSLSDSEKKYVFELIEKSGSVDKDALADLQKKARQYFENKGAVSQEEEELFAKSLLILYNNLQPQDFLHISPAYYETLSLNMKNRVFHTVKRFNKDVKITSADHLIALFNKLSPEERQRINQPTIDEFEMLTPLQKSEFIFTVAHSSAYKNWRKAQNDPVSTMELVKIATGKKLLSKKDIKKMLALYMQIGELELTPMTPRYIQESGRERRVWEIARKYNAEELDKALQIINLTATQAEILLSLNLEADSSLLSKKEELLTCLSSVFQQLRVAERTEFNDTSSDELRNLSRTKIMGYIDLLMQKKPEGKQKLEALALSLQTQPHLSSADATMLTLMFNSLPVATKAEFNAKFRLEHCPTNTVVESFKKELALTDEKLKRTVETRNKLQDELSHIKNELRSVDDMKKQGITIKTDIQALRELASRKSTRIGLLNKEAAHLASMRSEFAKLLQGEGYNPPAAPVGIEPPVGDLAEAWVDLAISGIISKNICTSPAETLDKFYTEGQQAAQNLLKQLEKECQTKPEAKEYLQCLKEKIPSIERAYTWRKQFLQREKGALPQFSTNVSVQEKLLPFYATLKLKFEHTNDASLLGSMLAEAKTKAKALAKEFPEEAESHEMLSYELANLFETRTQELAPKKLAVQKTPALVAKLQAMKAEIENCDSPKSLDVALKGRLHALRAEFGDSDDAQTLMQDLESTAADARQSLLPKRRIALEKELDACETMKEITATLEKSQEKLLADFGTTPEVKKAIDMLIDRISPIRTKLVNKAKDDVKNSIAKGASSPEFYNIVNKAKETITELGTTPETVAALKDLDKLLQSRMLKLYPNRFLRAWQNFKLWWNLTFPKGFFEYLIGHLRRNTPPTPKS
jgi:hypothetical protein